jgi:amino acid adenylation domain-containing protein
VTGSTWNHPARIILPASQRERRRGVNATDAEVRAEPLHAGFYRSLAGAPERIAVVNQATRLSYRDLGRLSGLVAEDLRRTPVAGTVVAVMMEKGWEQIVAVLGILSCGAAYVPIDPDLPTARVRELVDAISPAAVVTQPWLCDRIPLPADIPITVVEATDRECHDPSWHRSAHTDLAYVLFTSGSSGTPKGVMLSHGSVVNTLSDVWRRFAIGGSDSILAISELGFDLSVFDIFGLLGVGGHIVVPDANRKNDPRYLSELLASEKVTLWNSVPALLQLLLDEGGTANGAQDDHMRLVLLSGDWIPLELPARIRERFRRSKIVGLGGATEAAIWSVVYPIDDVDPAWRSIPYGRPLQSQQVYVMDDEMSERPDWAEGELYIGGAGVATGYWRDAARTDAQFIPHPVTGQRLYRTGDAARWWPSDILELIGRLDTQVKISGHRVELGEVEAALSGLPHVRECCVVVDGIDEAVRLVAFVTFGEQSVEHDELLESLRALLPAYMIPAVVHNLKQLPLTPNGKVDRRSLVTLAQALRGTQPRCTNSIDTRLSSIRERKVAAIWEELLDVNVSSSAAHFFELGGNSYIGLRLVSRLRDVFGTELGLGTIIEAPRLADFVKRLDDTETTESRGIVSLGRRTGRGALALVHPVGGGVFCYQQLAALLSASVDVYAIEATAYDDAPRAHGIEALASVYAERLAKHVGRDVPLVVGGWSMGGTVAAEMVPALQSRHVKVKGIVLVDPANPRPANESPTESELWKQFQRDHCSIGNSAEELEMPGDASAEMQKRFAIFSANSAALARHHVRHVGVPALLMRPVGAAANEEPWLTVLGSSLSRGNVGSDHYQLLREPEVVELAYAIAYFCNRLNAKEDDDDVR